MRKYLLILSILVFCISESQSTPELSLFSGNRCSTCHVNPQGGGMRNDFGWTFGKDASMFRPVKLGLADLYEIADKEDYSYLDGLLAFGTDFRFQTIRSHKTPEASRRYIPMQASLYGNSELFDWLLLEGSYNFGPKVFPGQQEWTGSLNLKLSESLPILRAGFFQPSIGLRRCDMTSFDRRIAASGATESLIAPYYAEPGLEIIYEGLEWLTLSSGVYMPEALWELSLYGDQMQLIRIKDNPSFSFRFVFWPEWLSDFFPGSMFGSSAYVNDNFWLINTFLGYSITEDLLITLEYAYSERELVRETHNWSMELFYTPANGLFLGARAEKAFTEMTLLRSNPINYKNYQVVLFANIILLPYIQLRPEYRYLRTEEYESVRWSAQFHFYY